MADDKKTGAKTLFLAYQKKDDQVQAARKALEVAMVERSACVEVIKKELGEGPFEWQGKVMKVSKRDVKEGEGDDEKVTGTTFFFRGIVDSVQKVE